jgi:hypothetical protein
MKRKKPTPSHITKTKIESLSITRYQAKQNAIHASFLEKPIKRVAFERVIDNKEVYKLHIINDLHWIVFEESENISCFVYPVVGSTIAPTYVGYVGAVISCVTNYNRTVSEALFFSLEEFNTIISKIEDFTGKSILDFTEGWFKYRH